MHQGNPHTELAMGTDGLLRPEGMEPYNLDPSGLDVVLERLGVTDPNKRQNALDYMKGTWNDGPLLRDESVYPKHQSGAVRLHPALATPGPYTKDIENIRQDEYSSSVHPLAKIGLYKGQGGEGAGPGWYDYPVRPLPMPQIEKDKSTWGFQLLNIPGSHHDFGWGTKATGITNIATEPWTNMAEYEANKVRMARGLGDPPIGATEEEYRGLARGQNTKSNQFIYEHYLPYNDGSGEMHGLADSMKWKLGSFSPETDIITTRIGGRRSGGVMDTVVHEGMHRGQSIMRQMYGGLNQVSPKFRNKWHTGQPDGTNYNMYWPGLYEGFQLPVQELNRTQTITDIIPGDLGLELMNKKQRKEAEASGVPYLEDRFLNKPWSWTFDRSISGEVGPQGTGTETEKVTFDLSRMLTHTGARGWDGEHVVNALIMQKYPGGLDAKEMSQSARDEWRQYISKMLADKEDEGYSLYGDRDKSEDYSKQWLYAYTNAAESITKYLENPHQWVAGGRKSTVQDRHIYGKYSPESVGARNKEWPPRWYQMR